MNIFLNCHASKKIGMGHFIRQLNIAEEMKLRGHNITFVIPGYDPILSLLDIKKLSYIKSHKAPFKVIPELEPDIIIFDISNTDKNHIKTLKKNCKKIISFDDYGTGRDYVDLLIDSNLSPSDFSKTKSLFGPKYVVIHNRFSALRNLKKEVPEKIKRIAISMGGTDPRCIGPIVTKFLLKSGIGCKIDLILGAGFNHKEIKSEDIKLIRNNGGNCKVYKNPPDLAKIFFNADLLICSGGITLYEACTVGTPALVISQVKAQQDKALLVQKWGAAINFGLWSESVLSKLLQTIRNLDVTKRKQMSSVGKKMVDGKGLKRVITEFEKLW